ncbi:MAG: tetratricopeptide repeat protein, partial [Gemmatimonadaceae bacterium]
MTPARSLAPRPLREDHLGASTFIEKGWNLIAQGDFAAAEKVLRSAILLAPSDLRARSLMGWAQMRQDKLDDALATLDHVLAEDAMNGLARTSIGYVCLKKGLHREAHEHLTRASRQASDKKAALYGWFYLGMLHSQQRNIVEAENCFGKTISLAPNFIEAYYELGRAYFCTSDLVRAEKTWREGHRANRFNVWGRRCSEAIRAIPTGREP